LPLSSTVLNSGVNRMRLMDAIASMMTKTKSFASSSLPYGVSRRESGDGSRLSRLRCRR
jgi:hypothetical protein